jgi:hypothetical protein
LTWWTNLTSPITRSKRRPPLQEPLGPWTVLTHSEITAVSLNLYPPLNIFFLNIYRGFVNLICICWDFNFHDFLSFIFWITICDFIHIFFCFNKNPAISSYTYSDYFHLSLRISGLTPMKAIGLCGLKCLNIQTGRVV